MTDRRIRVAHLITNLPVGGAQDYLLVAVRGLDPSVFERVVAGRMEGEWVDTVRNLPGVTTVDISALRRNITPVNDIRATMQIAAFCRRHRIDVLHTHSSKPGVVGRLGAALVRVPVVVHTIHGFSFHDYMSPSRRRVYVTLERFMSRYTTALLLVSHKEREKAAELRIGAKERVETVYNGIDARPFEHLPERAAVRASLGLTPEDEVIGFTGRLSDQKALPVLFEAFARIAGERPAARLLIVGDGPRREDLVRLAARLGIGMNVIMTGFRPDVAGLLAAMDVFAMTSLWEGLSRSLAEAMIAGVPVIATDVGGTADAVRNGETGWLIPANDPDTAARAMREALADRDRAHTMAARAQTWARGAFDLETMQKRIAGLYIDLWERYRRTHSGEHP